MAPLLPTIAAHAHSILSSAVNTHEHAVRTASARLSQVGPLAARAMLLARDDDNKDNKETTPAFDPEAGITDPKNINNTAVFVIFGLIGVAFVATGIWFFFWAKNGGFHFKENDWDDYKSTVLRRRGPNGTLLTGATPSTNLGGGSVYKDVVDDGATEYTGGLTQMTGETGDTSDTMSTLTGITAGASDIAGRERRRRAREKKEREHEKRKDRKNRERPGRRKVGEDGVLVDEEAEEEAKRKLRAYRHERAARVGGLNKESEASEWDGSTNPEMSTMAGSELLLSNRQSTPTSTPTKEKERDHEKRPEAQKKKSGGIRKVYSTADRTAVRESERLRAEAKRLAEKGRAAGSSSSRRDFSFQRADLRSAGSAIVEEETGSMISASEQQQPRGRYLPPPSYVAESDLGDGSDLGTKAYQHFIPGISNSSGVGGGSGVGSSSGSGSAVGTSVVSDYAEEKRRQRGAARYRRSEQ